MPSIAELTNLSQATMQPSIMGGSAVPQSNIGLVNPQNVTTNSKSLDQLSTDISKLVTGIETYGQKKYDLSVDAAKKMAVDNLATLEEQTTYIYNDDKMSFQEKRDSIFSLRQDLLTKSSNLIQDDAELKDVYDNIFSNSSKKYLSKILSSIDSKEYIYDAKTKANNVNDTLIKSPETAQWNDYLEGHKELINLQETTPEILKEKFIKQKLSSISDKYQAERTSFFNVKTGEFDDDRFEMIIGEDLIKDDRVQLYKNKLIDLEAQEIKSESSLVKNDILLEAFAVDTTSQIDILIERANTQVKDTGVRVQTLTTLNAMKGKLKSNLSSVQKTELTSAIYNMKNDISNLSYEALSNTDGSTTDILRNKFDIAKNTVNALYSPDVYPEKNKEEISKIEKVVKESFDEARYVMTQDVYKPNNPTDKDSHTKAVNKKRDREINLKYREGNLVDAAKLMYLNNGVPDEVTKDLKQKFATGNPTEIGKAVGLLNGLTKEDNIRHIVAKDNNLKYLFAFGKLASKNGLNEAEIETLQKINSGEANYAEAGKTADRIVRDTFKDLSNDAKTDMFEEARYLVALNIRDEDVADLLEASYENRIYVTSDTDTEVFNAPSWAKEDVVDKSVGILSEFVPDIKREGATVSKNQDDELVIKVGTGLKARTLAILDQETYLLMLGEYKTDKVEKKIDDIIKQNAGITQGYGEDVISSVKEEIATLYTNKSGIIGSLEEEGNTQDIITDIKNAFKEWSNRVNQTEFEIIKE